MNQMQDLIMVEVAACLNYKLLHLGTEHHMAGDSQATPKCEVSYYPVLYSSLNLTKHNRTRYLPSPCVGVTSCDTQERSQAKRISSVKFVSVSQPQNILASSG